MYHKVWRRCKVIDLLTKSTAFLCSRCILNSLICLFFGVTGRGGGGGEVVLFNHFARPPLVILALLRACAR